ncbi:transcriptional regulator [Pseudomonas cannabina]|uniref:transcriptional regulator n=1 Tax=Pseudomonas syringae group TaxID=136849 RepID=UPI0009C14696|nr:MULTISPECIES: YdaS family helix-turn-helix protein [Pseudomonas syringae group]QQN21022.1 helix-turn-helix domain-containing protein [Pseudomonas cannabina pv. alisalensis]
MSTEAMASVVNVLGSQTALSKVLGCTPQNVQRMCATGHVPAKHVLRIEAASGVSRAVIRPDIYPDHSPTLNANLRAKPAIDQCTDDAGALSSTGSAQ